MVTKIRKGDGKVEVRVVNDMDELRNDFIRSESTDTLIKYLTDCYLSTEMVKLITNELRAREEY